MAIFDVSIGTNDPAYRVGDFISFGEGMTLNAEEYEGFLRDLQEAVDPDEGWGNLLRPVFIVVINQGNAFSKFGEAIKKYTPARDGSKETHWHAAMGFGPNLKHLYSFSNGHEEAGNNKRKGGLAFESIEFYKKWYAPTATMQVSCILLAKENFAKVKETLEYYIKNKEKTSYHTAGLLDIFFGKAKEDKMRLSNICSQFVDSILRNSGIKVSNRPNNLMSPSDLKALEGDRKRFVIYDGLIAKYDPDTATEKVDQITKKRENEYFKIKDQEDKEKSGKKEDDKKEDKE